MFVPSYYEFVNPGKILSGKYALENIASEFRLLGSSRVFVLSDAVLEKLEWSTILHSFTELPMLIQLSHWEAVLFSIQLRVLGCL